MSRALAEQTALSTQPVEPPKAGPGLLAWLRTGWRRLTSMRTALVLLFLLALAAVPGSLLPQIRLNAAKVLEYRQQHPRLAPVLDRLGLFDVFSSPWFAAIYLLLFVSLVGCIVPRIRLHARALRKAPPNAPKRLSRLPYSARHVLTGTPEEVADQATGALRGWRVARRVEKSGAITLSAEKGYLRESGNLLFHISLTLLLVGVAAGKLWGYTGGVVLSEGESFCNTVLSFDQFSAGPMAGGLTPFCVQLERFTATYDPDGTPANYRADIRYSGAADPGGPGRAYPLQVNSPLRLQGDRVYLISHGFSPAFTVRTPAGQVFTNVSAPFLPQDANLTSEGAIKLPDALPKQIGIEGLFAPTAVDAGDGIIASGSPQPLNPAVAIFVYEGDLGLDTGQAQSVYQIDQRQIATGALKRVAAVNLRPGGSTKLADGTTITFSGLREWASFQVARDPGQRLVLIAFGLLLLGLLTSLSVRRRRFWVRLRPAPVRDASPAASGATDGADPPAAGSSSAAPESGRTVVEFGGLARTEAGGFGDEFARLVRQACGSKED
jgi:cytochrome c biogenesis protein